MKKIETIIRKTKFEDVREALHDAGIDFLTCWDAKGMGQSHQERIYRGVVYDTAIIERVFIVFYCNDEYVEPAIKAIISASQTGEVGDGKIFVSSTDEAYRIRTGEKGKDALGKLEIV